MGTSTIIRDKKVKARVGHIQKKETNTWAHIDAIRRQNEKKDIGNQRNVERIKLLEEKEQYDESWLKTAQERAHIIAVEREHAVIAKNSVFEEKRRIGEEGKYDREANEYTKVVQKEEIKRHKQDKFAKRLQDREAEKERAEQAKYDRAMDARRDATSNAWQITS